MPRLAILTVLIALLGTALPTLSEAQNSPEQSEAMAVARAVLAKTQWVTEAQLCPTTVITKREATDHLAANDCKPGGLSSCLARCSGGVPGSCYWLAYALQQQDAPPDSYESLYQRACKLGVMSGCTNRAAGILVATQGADERAQSCAAATFEAVCAFDDPWACTVRALHLSRGMGVKQDTERALRVLAKSCKYGAQDEACTYGERIRRDIEAGEQTRK